MQSDQLQQSGSDCTSSRDFFSSKNIIPSKVNCFQIEPVCVGFNIVGHSFVLTEFLFLFLCVTAQMQKRKPRLTWRSCKSKKWRRKRKRNTKRGRSTNEWRCTTAPAKPSVPACFSPTMQLQPRPPRRLITWTTPRCLLLRLRSRFILLSTTKHHTLPSCPLLPQSPSSTPLPTPIPMLYPPHLPPLPKQHYCLQLNCTHRAAIPAWLAWSLPRTST